jgi:hypothetical protein
MYIRIFTLKIRQHDVEVFAKRSFFSPCHGKCAGCGWTDKMATPTSGR